MRIYVGAKSDDWQRARNVMMALRQRGHTVTKDWTVQVEKHGPHHEVEPLTDAQGREYAEADRAGVLDAELVIGLWHPLVMGCTMEMGMAMAFAIETWLVGDWQYTIFHHLPTVTLLADDEFLMHRIACLPMPVGERP